MCKIYYLWYILRSFFFLSTVGFDMWHFELITGLVVLISSCRYLLLKTWPDFAESSEAANQQVKESRAWLWKCPLRFCKLGLLLVDCHLKLKHYIVDHNKFSKKVVHLNRNRSYLR